LLGLEECHRQGASAEQDRAGHPAAAAAAATVVEVPPEGAAVAAALVQELLSKADNCLELLDCQDMTASPAHNDHVLRPFSLYTLLDQLVGRLRSGGLAAGGRSRSKRSLAVAPGLAGASSSSSSSWTLDRCCPGEGFEAVTGFEVRGFRLPALAFVDCCSGA
jgi:hypothetical protein